MVNIEQGYMSEVISKYLKLLSNLDEARSTVTSMLVDTLNKEKGKGIIIDLAQLPESISREQWLYYLDGLNTQVL